MRESQDDPVPTDADVAVYIAEQAEQLRALAQRRGFGLIAYLLDMARLEAERIAGDDGADRDTSPAHQQV